jgi:Tfp pilus assembly protein PilN
MIQFNLLPDVKIAYIKAKRTKRIINLTSLLVAAVSIFVVTAMSITVYGAQNAQITKLNNDIKKSKASIESQNSKVSIDKILTVQNQLNSLDALHESKPVYSRIFSYLTNLVPAQVNISKVSVRSDSTMSITGTTDTIESVNKFVDTLKFTVFKESPDADAKEAFNDVVLSSFSRDKQGATYTINFNYEPVIFSGANTGTGLIVPKKITTRSELERPIFQLEEEKKNNVPLPASDLKGAR